MEYRKRNFAVLTSIRVLAVLALALWFFSFSSLMPRAALANMGAESRPPDYYLVGIDKIIVWANQPFDPERARDENQPGHPHIIPKVDFVALNRSIADQLRAALPAKMKEKIKIETIYDSPMHTGEPNKDENALILNFTFGYHVTQVGERQLVLGAVYPSIERLPPPELRQARVSGTHFFGYPPVPFLMEGDESAINASIMQATKKCVGYAADWIAHMPTEMPVRGKGGR